MRTLGHTIVLGLGASGAAAARLARLHGSKVTVLDSATSSPLEDQAEQLRAMGMAVHLEARADDVPATADLAVISPGVPDESDLAQHVRHRGLPLLSELEFGYRFCACPLLAVTGTNGKTTTVELLAHCLKRAGYRVRTAGNIGTPLSAEARRSHNLDALIVEVSSFQLLHVERFAPLAAAILNVSDDHLDRHGSAEHYLQAKLNLLRRLPDASRAVLRQDLADDPRVQAVLPRGCPTTFAGCDNGSSTYVVTAAGSLCRRLPDGGLQPLEQVTAPALRTPHNQENVLAALALGAVAGYDPLALARHVDSFAVGAHRLETVAVVRGVQFVNDSKATNPDAMRQALRALGSGKNGPTIHLIAGGLDKNARFENIDDLLKERVKGVFLIGSCRAKLAKQWGSVVSCRTYISLDAAFDAAAEEAAPGDVVLLSPACASQDMFSDYAHRGRIFRELVERRFGE